MNRFTEAHIEAHIEEERYIVFDVNNVICFIRLKTGFGIVGKSAYLYSNSICGQKESARRDAFRQAGDYLNHSRMEREYVKKLMEGVFAERDDEQCDDEEIKNILK